MTVSRGNIVSSPLCIPVVSRSEHAQDMAQNGPLSEYFRRDRVLITRSAVVLL